MADEFKDTVLAGEIVENLKKALNLNAGDEEHACKQKKVFSLIDGQPIRFEQQGKDFSKFL